MIAAVLCALGVIVLALGALVQVLDLSMAVIASLLVVLAVIELGGAYPYLVYAVTAILAMLLIPVKTAPLVYLCFAGYYPIVKAKLERHVRGVLCRLCKIVIFYAALVPLALIAVKILLIPLPTAPWLYWLPALLAPVFVLYDVALTRLITAYLRRWRDRFTFLRK